MSCTWGNWVFHWFMHSKQIYEPREAFEILLSPEITPLPTKPLLPYYPLRISRAWTMSYKDNTWFCWIFNGFFAGNLNIHLGFPICRLRSSSQSFRKTHQDPKALMLILLATYPLARSGSFFLLHVLWLDRDPLLFSILLLLLLFLSFSFFLRLWAFMVLLNFMNWAFFC